MNNQKTPITIQRMPLGTAPVFFCSELYAVSYPTDKHKDSSPSPDLTTLNECTVKGFVPDNKGHIRYACIAANP